MITQMAALYIGYAVISAIAALCIFAVLWFLFEAAYSVVATCSLLHFLFVLNKEHKLKKFTVIDAVSVFPCMWWFLLGTRGCNATWQHHGGIWNGIGNWHINPKVAK